MSNGVDFKKLALGLRTELTSTQSELAALREELAMWKGRTSNVCIKLTAAEQRNAELAQLLFYASERLSKVRYVGLHKRIKAALNPTESGASE